jgi:hypothetical protein
VTSKPINMFLAQNAFEKKKYVFSHPPPFLPLFPVSLQHTVWIVQWHGLESNMVAVTKLLNAGAYENSVTAVSFVTAHTNKHALSICTFGVLYVFDDDQIEKQLISSLFFFKLTDNHMSSTAILLCTVLLTADLWIL